MGNAGRTEPLTLIGPKGLARAAGAMRVIAPELPFEIQYREIEEAEQIFSFDGFQIKAFKVSHSVVCYGYSMTVERKGRFDRERAVAQEIPMKFWNRLQKGETIEDNGRRYTPEDVLGAARKGLKVTYCTDTRPVEAITANAAGSDLLILEGMYGEPDKLAKARENRHMTMYEAARIAERAGVPELWLTHYSPSLLHPEEYIKDVRKIFPQTIAAKDGRTIELNFDEE